jgi:transcriptional repressor NrdR
LRCPYCKGLEDRVVDSRLAEGGAAIRRRRECAHCGRRYTTFERAEPVEVRVVKRSGEREPFDREKVIAGMVKACKNRPVSREAIERVADDILAALGADGTTEVTSAAIGLAVLERLRELDDVAYVRFASVYKDFQEVTDFEREVGQLLEKGTPPKRVGAR